MAVGARLGGKARGRFSRRGTGDDRVGILPGGEEEEEEETETTAGSSAAAPEEEEEKDEKDEGAGRRKVRFALLPDSYEPLRAPGKRHYRKRLKKYGKEQSISFFHDGFDTSIFQHGASHVTHTVQFLDAVYSLSYHSDDIPKGKVGQFGFGSEDQHVKNVGKALQKGCRYLVVGLQGLASAYSAPFGVAAQVASFVR